MAACTEHDSRTVDAPEQAIATEGVSDRLGLMTTLPILWSEGDDFTALLAPDAQAHWALDALGQNHEVAAIDILTPDALAGLELLVLAQPRMLSPEENVALDDWVRGGGHALVFADPMLTGHSEYGVGDKRRPQDVALLDTLLARWGLALEAAPPSAETRFVAFGGGELPLAAHGELTRREPAGGAQSDCTDRLGRVLTMCAIGKGRAVILADAAILEAEEAPDAAVLVAFEELIGMAKEGPAAASGKSGE